MNKYLASYIYYDGDMNIINVVDDSNYITCNNAKKALERAIDYLIEQLDIVDIAGNMLYYTDDIGIEQVAQIKIYDENLIEIRV